MPFTAYIPVQHLQVAQCEPYQPLQHLLVLGIPKLKGSVLAHSLTVDNHGGLKEHMLETPVAKPGSEPIKSLTTKNWESTREAY